MRRAKSPLLIVVFSLILTLVAPFKAIALTPELKVSPAAWGYTIGTGNSSVENKNPAQKLTGSPQSNSFNLEQKSSFVVTYDQVPNDAKVAIQAAIDVWAANFVSSVPINVSVAWGKASGVGVLAAATPKNNFANFPGAPDRNLFYPSALANALAGKDLDPKTNEMDIRVTSNAPWYLGTDGNCPRTLYDLMSVILHEMAHGLGFVSNNVYDPFFGFGRIDQPTPFDAYAQLADGRRLADLPSPSRELGIALTSKLVWAGDNGTKANNGTRPLLYTPNPYEGGSSISHLDEKTFAASGANATMTPNLDFGEVFHEPGSILIGMFDDMRLKPPAGVTVAVPQVPQNVKAITADSAAIIEFLPPVNARGANISGYVVKNLVTNETTNIKESPAVIPNLKNGTKYSFSIAAVNDLGVSPSTTTNSITPMALWRETVVDPTADSKYLAASSYAGKPIIAYTDSKNGDLKLATWNGKKWVITTVDGNASDKGRTTNDVSGNVAICTGTSGKTNLLFLTYADLTNKDLRLAEYNGKTWSYSVVDGDGTTLNDYKDPIRTRSNADVSVSSGCSYSANGLQIFYRDETQGIVLGAVRDGKNWRYEIVDGDKDTNDRTLGDTAFHMKVLTNGRTVTLVYDSVLNIDRDRNPTRGEMRVATRNTIYPEDWVYTTIDTPDNGIQVTGFDVAANITTKGVNAGWFTATGISLPNPNGIRFRALKEGTNVSASFDPAKMPNFAGAPASPIAIDNTSLLFGCQKRLCMLNKFDQVIKLVTDQTITDNSRTDWLTIGKTRYAVIGASGQLKIFRP